VISDFCKYMIDQCKDSADDKRENNFDWDFHDYLLFVIIWSIVLIILSEAQRKNQRRFMPKEQQNEKIYVAGTKIPRNSKRQEGEYSGRKKQRYCQH
jgi:hypothetical protein